MRTIGIVTKTYVVLNKDTDDSVKGERRRHDAKPNKTEPKQSQCSTPNGTNHNHWDKSPRLNEKKIQQLHRQWEKEGDEERGNWIRVTQKERGDIYKQQRKSTTTVQRHPPAMEHTIVRLSTFLRT